MSEWPPPVVPASAAGHPAQALTPEEIDAVLAEFRTWIERAAAAGSLPDADELPAEAPPDLHTLLSQFTALRHEVNLQTRAVRAQQEQNAETLEQYRAALEALQAAQAAGDEAVGQEMEELLRPQLKHLVDAYDALALARREVERVRQALPPPEQESAEPLSSNTPGFWVRLFGRTRPATEDRRGEQRRARLREAAERVTRFFESVLTGYTMSLQRLERALQHCDLEPIASVGEPFDPELMEVVEVTADSGRPAGEVLEEVRRGYLWRGRVFRYALVRVARP